MRGEEEPVGAPYIRIRVDRSHHRIDVQRKERGVDVAAVGDDNIVLSTELRAKAVDGFNALAWAYNEASK